MDWNGIDMTLIKRVIIAIVDPLVYICNVSFKTGSFPNKMKIARVIPLYKAGEKLLFTDYRPVSLLPHFSKILGKLFVVWLDNFVELMELVEELTNFIDGRKYAVRVFIDRIQTFTERL